MPLAGRNLTLPKTPLHFNENASAFHTKRPCVWIETQGRFTENSFTFYFKRKGVFFRSINSVKCTENSCQFED